MIKNVKAILNSNFYIRKILNYNGNIAQFIEGNDGDFTQKSNITATKNGSQTSYKTTSNKTGTGSMKTKYICDEVYGGLTSGGSGLIASVKLISSLNNSEVVSITQTNINSNSFVVNGKTIATNFGYNNNSHLYLDPATKTYILDTKNNQNQIFRGQADKLVPTYLLITVNRIENFGNSSFYTNKTNFINKNTGYSQVNS